MATQYAGGPILSIPVTAGGTGYSSAPSVVLAGTGAGFGATFTVNFSGGSVTSITVTAGGHLYPISGVTATISGGGGSGATLGAVVVSSGDVNTTFTNDGTKQNIINGIETALLAAAWTTISGHGTTNLLMQTHATPYPLQMNFRFKDNGGTGVQISVENTSGSVAGTNNTSNGASLNPVSSRVFRVIANPYQFCVLVPSIFATGCTWAFGGVPYVPSFVTGVTAAGILLSNAANDTDTSFRASWRAYLTTCSNNMTSNFQAIWNANLSQFGDNPNGGRNSIPNFVLPLTAYYNCLGANVGTYCQPYRWANLQIHSADPLLSWGNQNTSSDEPLIRGQLWDAILVMDSYAGDSTSSWDNHNWYAITSTNPGAGYINNDPISPRGTLWIVTP